MLKLPARYSRWVPLLAPAALILLFIHLNSGFSSDSLAAYEPAVSHTPLHYSPERTIQPSQSSLSATDSDLPASCRPLPGMEDVLVVLKTGITEAQDKVPVHVRTTLRCIPNKLIVSDFEEEIAGLKTYDVFRNSSEELRANEDFALYNRARERGRQGLQNTDHTKVENGMGGMSGNPGWKLDKWKFLPMVTEARNYMPDAKWYVFMEADTYPIWPNLVAWLAEFPADQKLYIGNQMMIGDDVFAHGGSGFILSHDAIHAVADEYGLRPAAWHERTHQHWAGDCILGIALATIGIPLLWSWPHVTDRSLWEQDALNEGFGTQQWCYPPFTFHHMTPKDVDRIHDFELQWFANDKHSLLLYSDLFKNLVRPMLESYAENWDNFAQTELKREGDNSPFTPYECAEQCALDVNCLQYRIDDSGRCSTTDQALRGRASAGVKSGTMMWRVDARIKERGKCQKPKFVTANP
ncbi:hypothetical protein N7468_003895 [Penicillium chermesinum]|uniref:N-acetylgalactosaminide beta-1,3-galactosyltransferase n=1 Tax=Penicillium chermesinum TaxID=63820 RepID=A0A9W9P832_9EURO|nr:uncharacterized protein N7468_003895 [Penicillium chermesinum]KAJ5239276.1 hypothetical protein N7468_003895 [Penicillium chermesinum]